MSLGLIPQALAQKSCKETPAARMYVNTANKMILQAPRLERRAQTVSKTVVPRVIRHVFVLTSISISFGPKSLKFLHLNWQHVGVWLRES